MKQIKITCDNCMNDITQTDATPAYRIELQAKPMPHSTSFIHDLCVMPPIDREMYFCGVGCLKQWVNKND